MTHDDLFGELRSLTQLAPHPTRFERILDICALAPQEQVTQTFLPYLTGALSSWPANMRKLPAAMVDTEARTAPLVWPLIGHLHLSDLDSKSFIKTLKSIDLSGITHLTLERCVLGPKAGVTELIQSINAAHTPLLGLTLDDCTLGAEALERLLAEPCTQQLEHLGFTSVRAHTFAKKVGYQDKSALECMRDMPVHPSLDSFSYTCHVEGRVSDRFLDDDPRAQATLFEKMPELTHLGLHGVLFYSQKESTTFGQSLSALRLTSLDLRNSEFRDLQCFSQNDSTDLITHLGLTLQSRHIPIERTPNTFHMFDVFEACPNLESLSLYLIERDYDFLAGRPTRKPSVSARELDMVMTQLADELGSGLKRFEIELKDHHEVVGHALTPERFPDLDTVRIGNLLDDLYGQPARLDTYSALIEALLKFPPGHPLHTIEWAFSRELSARARGQLKGMLSEYDTHLADIATLRRAYGLYSASERQSVQAPVVALHDHTIHLKHLDARKVQRLAADARLAQVKSLTFEGSTTLTCAEDADAWDAFWSSPHLCQVRSVDLGGALTTLTSTSLERILTRQALPALTHITDPGSPLTDRRFRWDKGKFFRYTPYSGPGLSYLCITLLARLASGLFVPDMAHPMAALCDWNRLQIAYTFREQDKKSSIQNYYYMVKDEQIQPWHVTRISEDTAWSAITHLRLDIWWHMSRKDLATITPFFELLRRHDALTHLEVTQLANDLRMNGNHLDFWPELELLSKLESLVINSHRGYDRQARGYESFEHFLQHTPSSLVHLSTGDPNHEAALPALLGKESQHALTHLALSGMTSLTSYLPEDPELEQLEHFALILPERAISEAEFERILASPLYQSCSEFEVVSLDDYMWKSEPSLHIAGARHKPPLSRLKLTRCNVTKAGAKALSKSSNLSEKLRKSWAKKADKMKG